jgi:cytochrome c553
MLYRVDALRTVVRNAYDILWCAGVKSSHVTADAVNGLKALDLRQGEGWRDLAKMPVCTDCHARLDYGVQFFAGYQSVIHAVDVEPSRHHDGEGPLYRDDITDPIGTGPLTPHGFVELVVAQPEYERCIVRDVVEHVFGDDIAPEDRDALATSFHAHRALRPVMREALVRYARRRWDSSTAPAPAPTVAANASGARIVLAAPLRARVASACGDCHDHPDNRVDLLAPDLPREVVVTMLTQVAFGIMPANGALPEAQRRAFASDLIATLWSAPGDRDAALRLFGDRMRAERAHRPLTVLDTIARPLATQQIGAALEEDRIPAQLDVITPGYTAAIAIEALDLCKAAHVASDDLATCATRALSPTRLLVDE